MTIPYNRWCMKSFKEIGNEINQKTESVKKTFYRYKHLLLINEDYFVKTKETRGGIQKCVCLSDKATDFLFKNRKGRLFEKSFGYMLHTILKDVLKFEGQKKIGNYVFDFYCRELDLFIEYDEAHHQLPQQRSKDHSKSREVVNLVRIKKGEEYMGLNLIIKTMMRNSPQFNKYRNISSVKNTRASIGSEIEKSLAEVMFNEIMPEVEFVDITPNGDIAGGARRQLEKKLGKSIVSKQNYLANPQKSLK